MHNKITGTPTPQSLLSWTNPGSDLLLPETTGFMPGDIYAVISSNANTLCVSDSSLSTEYNINIKNRHKYKQNMLFSLKDMYYQNTPAIGVI